MANYRPVYLRSVSCSGNCDAATSDPTPVVHQLLSQISEAEDAKSLAHQVYSQLDCLQSVSCQESGTRAKVWREKFRWIKYEEEMEAVGNRWSKPYVPILSPFALMEARRELDSGLVDLQPVTGSAPENAEEKSTSDLEQFVQHLCRQLADSGLQADVCDEIRSLLLLPHWRFTDKRKRVLVAAAAADGAEATEDSVKFNKKYQKKVHQSAEGCEIFVGRSPLVKETVSAFVRLGQPAHYPILEIDVPIRFFFVVIAPNSLSKQEVVDIGRSVATMMADEIFREVAYLATDKAPLLAAVDEFLKNASILPPIGCGKSDRIPPMLQPPNMQHRHAEKPMLVEVVHDEIPGLERSGRLFGGLINDIKRRWPHYRSDFTDALHPQTIGSFFFIYFACLTPIITFGGLLSDATKGYLGAIESIVSGLICGVSFALFSGQPLTILGSTGPVLVFETIVFNNCERFGWEYLSLRWWIGMWTCLILLIAVACDLSFLVKYITRFTEESFALLIAVIFIYEAIAKLWKISSDYPVNWDWGPKTETIMNCSCIESPNSTLKPVPPESALFVPTFVSDNQTVANLSAMDYYSLDWKFYKKSCVEWGGEWVGDSCDRFRIPDVFFFSCLLFIFTYVISSQLKGIKTASIFPAIVRGIISDFAVMIAIALMTLVDFIAGLKTPKLLIPTKFEPTLGFEIRGWIVHPFGRNPWYSCLIALGPAVLAVILIFLDQQITGVIVNRRENKLRKGVGYHLDLLVVAICIGVNSALGIPWFVAATVLSINHVLSLKKETECSAPGEKPTFLGCRENRVTGFLVFLTIGLSVFMTPVLQHIPMPVLYGVFLFMGTASLNGLQLCQRVLLFVQPTKYQPDFRFLREVKMRRVHFFTLIQLVCFALLWAVKKISVISILFPLMVLSMCFIRKLLDWLFTRDELRLLDDLFPEQVKQEQVRKRRESRFSIDKPPKDEETALCDAGEPPANQ